MVKVLLDDMAKVPSGVDQRHRGLVDAPAEFTWLWSGRTGGDYWWRRRGAGGRHGQRGGSRTLTPSPRPLDQDGWSASTTCFLRVFSCFRCCRVRMCALLLLVLLPLNLLWPLSISLSLSLSFSLSLSLSLFISYAALLWLTLWLSCASPFQSAHFLFN